MEVTPSFSTIQPSDIKKSKIGRLLLLVLFFVLFSLLFWVRVIIVLDHDTYLPLSSVNIEVRGPKFFVGCVEESNHRTILGIAFLAGRRTLGVCSIHIKKDGYHPNGENTPSAINLPPWIDIITIQKIKKPQNLVVKEVGFSQGDKADFLSAIFTKDTSKLRAIPKEVIEPTDIDFDFPVVSNTATESNVIGGAIVKMRFFGNGGVQQLPGGGGSDNATYRQYALENLMKAPIVGYSKELSLESGGQYVAKLRDGKHYMKFFVFASKNLAGQSFANLKFLIQPDETSILESTNTFTISTTAPETNFFVTPPGPDEFKVDFPKNNDVYYYDEDVLFSGTAPSTSSISISAPENRANWTIQPNTNGKWSTYIGDSGTGREANETFSYCASGCSYADNLNTRNVTISAGDKSYTIKYVINRKRVVSRKVNFGYFILEIPADFIATRDKEISSLNIKDGMSINFYDAQNYFKQPALFSIDGIWRGDEIELLNWARKYSTWNGSQYETFSLGKFAGYKIPGGRNPSITSTIFLGYKNMIIKIDNTKVRPDISSALVKILSSFQPVQ